jgi:hypothetical protein
MDLRRETMATTQQTGNGFCLTNEFEVLESDHVQHLTFGPVWATQIRPTDKTLYAQWVFCATHKPYSLAGLEVRIRETDFGL